MVKHIISIIYLKLACPATPTGVNCAIAGIGGLPAATAIAQEELVPGLTVDMINGAVTGNVQQAVTARNLILDFAVECRIALGRWNVPTGSLTQFLMGK